MRRSTRYTSNKNIRRSYGTIRLAPRNQRFRALQVAIDTSTASKKDIEVGQTIRVQGEGSAVPMRVAGVFDFSSEGNIGGATLAAFNLRTAQSLFDKEGQLDQIRTAAKPGVSREALIRQIREILPPETRVRSGEGQAEEDASDTKAFLTFLQTFLLSFGGIALFVGAFVIANSLSSTIAQRTREFATLRTIGASRRQICAACWSSRPSSAFVHRQEMAAGLPACGAR